MSSSVQSDENSNVEVKRRRNIEDNRRFLATLKINDIRDEIKHGNNQPSDSTDKASIVVSGRRAAKRSELHSDDVRRSSRIRKNKVQTEKTTDENRPRSHPKVKLQLPAHMLSRYQSTGKRVALHNSKIRKAIIMSSKKEEKNTNETGDAPKQPEEKTGQLGKNQAEKTDEPKDNKDSKSASTSGGHDVIGFEKYDAMGGSGGVRRQSGSGVEAMAHH